MAKTTAQQRADARERQRKYRERQKALRGDVTRDTGDGDTVTASTTMRDAVDRSLKAMKWLVDSDDAAVELAKSLAEDVDVLRHQGEMTKALSARRALTTILDRLGGTPTIRMMHELRSLRAMPETPEVPDDGSGEAQEQSGNVSQFKRPARRSS